MFNPEIWDTPNQSKNTHNMDQEPFTLLLPPPNITGTLHLGHLLNATIQDALARRARLQGKDGLWIPGTDHATTATQMLLEKKLQLEGRSRHDMSRAEFMAHGECWRELAGGEIITQLKGLNMSLDFERERYTMDEKYCETIKTAFHRLHDKGHIYRDWALISYSPGLDSAISDLEIEREDEQTTLYYLGYPLSDGTYLEIATTSLHTIGADRALIINPEHPERPRFEALTAINPFTHESMPIIFDDQIDLEFGSGAMKCTPLHDQTDWELAKKHDLEMGYPAMSLSGEMTHLAESLHGLTIAEAREAAPDLLKRFIIRTEPHTQPIPRCTRTKARIETLPAWQWHLDTKELGAPIIEALQNGEIEIHPETQRERMITWLQEGRPWCLSRQLWWGHQIPMHEDEMGNWHTDPGEGRTQDQDILDTWFSSALWSLASLGWPDKNADFDRYYPIDSIISGRDILNLWISRMLMLGHFFTGQLPFKKIYLHGTILDKHGKPMSKTRGNGIDPRDLQKQHGTDSTRFAIMSLASSQDIRWQTHAPERAARTLRKLYNASRLLGKPSNEICEPQNELQYWIESKFNHLIGEFEQGLDQAGWHRPCKALEYFLEKEFCPWYLEAYKLDKEGEFAYAKYLLFRILSIASIICPNMTTYLLEGLDPAWPPDARATEGSELIESTWQAIHLRRRGQDHQHISRDELLFRGIR